MSIGRIAQHRRVMSGSQPVARRDYPRLANDIEPAFPVRAGGVKALLVFVAPGQVFVRVERPQSGAVRFAGQVAVMSLRAKDAVAMATMTAR